MLYDVRGPVVDEASRMEEEGIRVLKLNIGNPAHFRVVFLPRVSELKEATEKLASFFEGYHQK